MGVKVSLAPSGRVLNPFLFPSLGNREQTLNENCFGPEVIAPFLLKPPIHHLFRISPSSETYLFCSTFSKQGRHNVFPSNRRVRDSMAISPPASPFKLAKMRAGLGAGRPGSVTANSSSRSAFLYLSFNVSLSF